MRVRVRSSNVFAIVTPTALSPTCLSLQSCICCSERFMSLLCLTKVAIGISSSLSLDLSSTTVSATCLTFVFDYVITFSICGKSSCLAVIFLSCSVSVTNWTSLFWLSSIVFTTLTMFFTSLSVMSCTSLSLVSSANGFCLEFLTDWVTVLGAVNGLPHFLPFFLGLRRKTFCPLSVIYTNCCQTQQ